MPGIFGVVDKSVDAGSGGGSTSALRTMAASMKYEPFYLCRMFQAPELGVHAAWVGLPSKTQEPVSESSTGVWLLPSGEPGCTSAENDSARNGSASEGGQIPSLLRLYEQSGEEFLTHTVGQFSGFLIDERRGTSLLFNDRFGMERLFVYEDGERFVFSSEAKAILAAVPETRELSLEGLGQLLACGGTFGEVSLFRGVRVLPPGTVVRFQQRKEPHSRAYFDRAAWENLEPLPERLFLDRVGETLDRVVKHHVKTPPRVAISLTGGLDSRMIMAAIEPADGTVPCYTFGSANRDTYDVKVARNIARLCGQPHEVLVLGDDFDSHLPEHLEKAVFVSDGHLGLSGAAELYLNRLARSVAPIRITGNYGGELLRGFRAFKGVAPRSDFLRPELVGEVEQAIRAFSRLNQLRPLSFTLFVQAPAGYGRYAIERSQVTVRSPFLDDRLVQTLYRMPPSLVKSKQLSLSLIGRRRPDLLAVPTDRGLLGDGGRLAHGLRRVSRETLFKAEYWTGHGAPNWVTVLTHRAPGAWVERAFRGRHKFAHPGAWFRGVFAEYARETLTGSAADGLAAYFDMVRVSQGLVEHLAGTRNHVHELDKLLTIALIRRLLDSFPARIDDSVALSLISAHTVK